MSSKRKKEHERVGTAALSSATNVRPHDLQSVLEELLEKLKDSSASATGVRWFPNGITHLEIDVKVGGAEARVVLTGPDSAGGHQARRALDASPDVTFTITQRVGKKARGTLSWDAMGLSSPAVSGDSNHDAINVGTWQGVSFQERPGDDPYCDKNGHCWFSVFADAYGRTGIGIHPDGGVPDATLGCIGISDSDTQSWHDALSGKNGKITCLVVEQLPLMLDMKDDGIKEL